MRARPSTRPHANDELADLVMETAIAKALGEEGLKELEERLRALRDNQLDDVSLKGDRLA